MTTDWLVPAPTTHNLGFQLNSSHITDEGDSSWNAIFLGLLYSHFIIQLLWSDVTWWSVLIQKPNGLECFYENKLEANKILNN